MKPIKITVSAFGPYAGKEEIDMTKLGSHGLYLVTGDTGAGKTTIFDAVCYALFGESSGGQRDEKMFRSTYADPDTKTYVEMIFNYCDKNYRVYREPKQLVRKKRGEGFTEQQSVGEFYDNDTDDVIAVKNIDAKIEEVLGFGFEQYKNVAMIAQGSFQQLLNTNSKERTEILSSIFNTGKYRVLQDRIKSDFNAVDDSYKNSVRNISSILKDISADEKNPHREKLYETAENFSEVADHEELKTLCENVLEWEDKNTAELKKLSDIADQNAADADKILSEAKGTDKLFRDLEKAEKDMTEAENALKAAEEEHKKAEDCKPQAEKLSQEIAVEQQQLGEYDAAEKISYEAQKLKNSAEVKSKNAEKMKADLAAMEERLKAAKSISSALADIFVKIEKENTAFENQKKKLTEITEMGNKVNNSSEHKKVALAAKKEYLKAEENKRSADKLCSDIENAYNQNIAGILACELKDSEPCPVCGSCVHPAPAVIPPDAPTENDVKKARSARDDAAAKADNAARNASAKMQAFETHWNETKERLEQYSECGDGPDDILNQLREIYKSENVKLNEIKERLSALNESGKKKQAADAEIPELESSIKSVQENVQQIEKAALQDKTSAEEKFKSAEAKIVSLKFSSKKEADENISRLTKQKNDIELLIKNAENDLSNKKQAFSSISGAAQTLRSQVKDKVRPDIAKLTAELEDANKAKAAADSAHRKALEKLSVNKKAVSDITAELKNNLELMKQHMWMSELSRTADGSVSNQAKIQLETYVQLEYFDRILAHANVRLLQMTGGQYELVRSEQKNGNAKVGLDIDVKDYYTDTVRSIKSLSGGESFMASLALALGFSDEIQQSAGGIRLDSMFVDEGFGTLDDESLTQAVKTLSSLAEDSRLVGIISHVPELKDKLDKQIVVRKNKQLGSTVEIVT